MVPLFLHSLSAFAGEDGSQWAIPPETFQVARGDAKLRVSEIGMPKPVPIDPKFRVCRVSVEWKGGRWSSTIREGCHPNLVDYVADAADRWVIDVTSRPSRDRELFEYWYVFPLVKGDPVRVFVRQAWEQELVLKVPEIDLLDWSIKGRMFPEYPPAAAVATDTRSTVCDVKIDIAASGVPGEILITGCDDVFVPDLLDNLQSWRWGGPELDGVPFPSGVTIGVKFQKNLDGGAAAGKVELVFPPDADLGDRTRLRAEAPVYVEPDPPPMPTWPALFVMDHKSFAEVGVYDVMWPAPPSLEEEVLCDVLFQVNSARRVWAWTETCDERVRSSVEAAAGKWNLVHGEIGEGERFARFRGTFVFPAGGGHPRLRISAEDLESSKPLPEYVETYVLAQTIRSVPPKLPRGFATEVTDDRVRCEYDVLVDRGGKPAEIAARSCPGGYGEYAEKAIAQWRWTPAAADGKPIDSHVTVRIRFEQPPTTPELGTNG